MDSYQRERYFHGVNVVVKGPPWIPRTDKFDTQWSFSEEDMQLLRKWGLNGIRLGLNVEVHNNNYEPHPLLLVAI